MKGSKDTEITFDDLPANAVKEMIHMLYIGHWEFGMVADPIALFRVADRFLLPHVKELCVHFIRKLLKQSGSSIVIQALQLTQFYDLPELFQACVPVVKSHVAELDAHDWSLLQDLGLVRKVLEACMSEDCQSQKDMESIDGSENDVTWKIS